MQLRSWIAWVAGVTVLAWSTIAVVQAQMETSSDITVPSSFVDAATSAPAPAEPPPVSSVSAAQEPSVTLPAPAEPPPVSPVTADQVPSVTFPQSEITDAVPERFFDAATTTQDGNKLLIGLGTGFDAKTWTVNEFTASTAAFHHAAAMDTISFLIVAPKGYYIAKITYTQRGTHATSRTGRVAGGVHWVVDGVAADLGLFGTDPTLSGTVDLTGQNKVLVPVSITCGLFAFAPPLVGSASISIASAEVLVELLSLPQ